MLRLGQLNLISGLASRFEGRKVIEEILELHDKDPMLFKTKVESLSQDAVEISSLIQSLQLDTKRPAGGVKPEKKPLTTAKSPPEDRGRPKMVPRQTLEPDQEYSARIVSIKKFGAFATLVNVTPKTDGLIHISQMANDMVDDPESIVSLGEMVRVKIVSIEGNRISLSMKLDQEIKKPPKKRWTSPERFEIRQLIAAGVYSAKDFPELDAPDPEIEAEENVEVEVKKDLPKFLKALEIDLKDSSRESQPVPQLIPSPDGNLAKAIEKSGSREPSNTKHFRPKPAPISRAANVVDRTLSQQRKDLPVFKFRSQLLDAVQKNQIIIVQGDTGSGKTTQITQYLYEEGYSGPGKAIACTQPRRVAAVSIADRVAHEMGTKLGDLVGYSIRFENVTSEATRVKYMTDGILQQEVVSDPLLSRYSVVILDEAHERTIATDVLFALLKRACKARSDLKVIITSATLDATKFSEYFSNCPVYKIPGRTFPVDIQYSQQPEFDYLEAAMFTAMQVHMSQPDGDILVFLTGQEEIDSCCNNMSQRAAELEGIMSTKLIILPLYSSLPGDIQARIFDPTPQGYRKLIFATNIAETSITIDGIRYVIDSGVVKSNVYDPQASMDVLKVVPVSKAQASQRAGRAGRTQPGKCYRLYTKETFDNEMLPSTIPEIQRHDLASTLLMLKVMGIDDVFHFDFMDKPPALSIFTALQELFQLGALDAKGTLTSGGRVIAKFPMNPSMAQVLLQSVRKFCAHEVLTIMAMLNLNTVFIRPSDPKKNEEIERKRRKFKDPSGDHLTLLNIYDGWAQSGYSSVWCNEFMIHERTMRRAQHIRQQLKDILTQLKLRIVSCQRDRDLVLKVLCSGYFRNVAKNTGRGYKTISRETEVAIHPQSVLFSKHAKYVLYHSLIMTSREYMNCVSIIQPAWLLEYANNYYSSSENKEKIAPMLKKHENSEEWRISQQHKFVKYESTRF